MKHGVRLFLAVLTSGLVGWFSVSAGLRTWTNKKGISIEANQV